jgi:hypothetical protein
VVTERAKRRRKHGSPDFRRRFQSVPVVRWFGYPWETVSEDAPLTPDQATIWRLVVVGILIVGVLAVVVSRF